MSPWVIVGLIVAVGAFIGGAIYYVKHNAASAVELEQADKLLEAEKAKRAAEEKQRVEVQARVDKEFHEKADAVRTVDDAIALLRKERAGLNTD